MFVYFLNQNYTAVMYLIECHNISNCAVYERNLFQSQSVTLLSNNPIDYHKQS